MSNQESLLFDVDFSSSLSNEHYLLIVDEHVYLAHSSRFKKEKIYILKSGEAYKTLDEAEKIILWLHHQKADRQCIIVGIGGGVTTDLVGFVAAIFLRGVRCFLVPTSILAMCDAAIGGKNGVDFGNAKNIIGTIRQPSKTIYDFSFLDSLPIEQWRNGFAEIIKHAAIANEQMFADLMQHDINFYRQNLAETKALIKRNVTLKQKIVEQDPFEKNLRKILNYGHTLGHALEMPHKLLHGEAIAIGMHFANYVADHEIGFGESKKIMELIELYDLPINFSFDPETTIQHMYSDKKRVGTKISFVVLETIGKAKTIQIAYERLLDYLKSFSTWQKA